MENLFKQPKLLVLVGNISENWRRFLQKFNLFLMATDLASKEEEKNIAIFLNLLGDEGLELFNSFTFVPDADKKLDNIKNKFEDYCSPKRNLIFERYKFNSITQKECQIFDNFVTELRKAIKTPDYKEPDDMIRDRIVMGILDKSTQERLLREANLTLTKCLDFCRAIEASKNQAKVQS